MRGARAPRTLESRIVVTLGNKRGAAGAVIDQACTPPVIRESRALSALPHRASTGRLRSDEERGVRVAKAAKRSDRPRNI